VNDYKPREPGGRGVPGGDSLTPPSRIDSRSLLGAAQVLLIDHEGETYCLRRTRLGKLILTK